MESVAYTAFCAGRGATARRAAAPAGAFPCLGSQQLTGGRRHLMAELASERRVLTALLAFKGDLPRHWPEGLRRDLLCRYEALLWQREALREDLERAA